MDESDLDSVLLNRLVFCSLVDGLGYTEISRFVSILNMSCFTKESHCEISSRALDLTAEQCDEALTKASKPLIVNFDRMLGNSKEFTLLYC